MTRRLHDAQFVIHKFWDFALPCIPDHIGHAFQRRKLVRSPLRIAAGDDDASRGVRPMDLPYCFTSLSIGCRCDRASVQHDHICRRGIRRMSQPFRR